MSYIIHTLDGTRLGSGDTRDQVKVALYRLGLIPYGSNIGRLPKFGRSTILMPSLYSLHQNYVISYE